MATKKVVDKLLPTTMVGSYPRPGWFKHQLLGRDIRVAFKEVQHEEAYNDAVATVIREQEDMGLDIVTDGNMWYDDYVGVIGSFCWYMYERIGGFEQSREEHPSMVGAPKSAGKDIAAQKTTYPALIGLESARREARRLTALANRAIEPFGTSGVRLRQLADHLLAREY